MLLIDAGNTRIKWALAAEQDAPPEPARMSAAWPHSGSVARADWMQLARIWRDACSDSGNMAAMPRRVLISNVAGPALRDQLQDLLRQLNPDPDFRIEWLASQAALGGVQNAYRQPAQLGCDRFASAIGAHALFPDRALIVATCGTATTIDAITPEGRFIGGMILPGLGLMATSLALNTAQLPQVSAIDASAPWFADNTEQAIISGCIAAQTGAIERAVRRHRRQYADTLCLLAGGAGAYLTAHLAEPHERLDNLVLIGLHVLATKYPNLC
ncbi:type III pantothenate kinase [Oxalobacteraceae bacterium CAVE-383]|nr:type III pantothenate kinase [Oxalobacteraceae bacterium CAVE-383]